MRWTGRNKLQATKHIQNTATIAPSEFYSHYYTTHVIHYIHVC